MAMRKTDLQEHDLPPALSAAIDDAHKRIIDAMRAEGATMWRVDEESRLHWMLNRYAYYNLKIPAFKVPTQGIGSRSRPPRAA